MKTRVACMCSALLPLCGVVAAPEQAVPVAWVRFVDTSNIHMNLT